MTKFLFLDIETTGLNPEECDVTQIAAIMTDETGMPMDELNVYVSLPEGKTVPPMITELTGIDDALLAEKGVSKGEAAEMLKRMWDMDTVVVAQYAPFDLPFLEKHGFFYEGVGLPFICTRTMSYYLRPGKRASLKDLAHVYGVNNPAAHDAINDARTTKDVFFAMLSDAGMSAIEGLMMFEGVVGERRDRPVEHTPLTTRAKVIFGREPLKYDVTFT